MRQTILARQRTFVSVLGVAVLLALFVVPWSTRVEVASLLEADDAQQVFPAREARIKRVVKRQGDVVTSGDAIIEFEAPDLISSIALTKVRLKAVELRLARRAADEIDRAQSLVLKRERTSLLTRLDGLNRERLELVARAPVSGTIIESDTDLHAGRWVGRGARIALVGDRNKLRLSGYINEADIGRLEPGATGKFIPDDPTLPSRAVVLISIRRAGAVTLDHPELASVNGGPIAARRQPDSTLVPVASQFQVTMHTNNTGQRLPHTIRGVVHLSGKPESIFARMLRQVLSVLVRESGA